MTPIDNGIVILSGASRSLIARSAVEGPAGRSKRHRRTTLFNLLTLVLLALTTPAHAHINNKDVFQTIETGPYKLFVTVRTPTVIPGVATVEVRSSGAPITGIQITPIPLTGEASKHPPTADPMQRSPDDPAFYTGSIWLMASGSWQIRMAIDGSAGPATAGVPVPAIPLLILPMQRSMGFLLACLGLILTLGVAGIVGAAVREARLTPGVTPTPDRRRRAAMAAAITLVFMAFALFFGNKWWNVEAATHAANVYKPSDLHATLTGNTLNLTIGDYNEEQHKWKAISLDNLLLDHGHPMHLYAIRQPGMDAAFHLHPAPVGDKTLSMTLPTMPPGTYKLYADIVYRNGFPETLTTTLTIPPNLPNTPLASEDASAAPPAIASTDLGPTYKFPDGYTMVWDRPASIAANTGYPFRFTLLDHDGHPAQDMQPYLGMAGHAAFVKDDGTTFAHTHPEGSAAMPAVMLANPDMNVMSQLGDAMNMVMEGSTATQTPPSITFPYGFPSPGRYRIFIQMKHATTVETGVFDAEVQ
jgi:hypothetical protein